ncbi:MAG: protein-export membrane protein SecD [Legionellales bacterium RIFCSPHIGHO2_12_FULL_37_14]|nr:MAG: protein-export membrane protein SecD [Legionellales bacterium RIFCSPHIGHO2_12_FULL_37_14]
MTTNYSYLKNTLLVVLVVLGIIYALPNLYGEQPVVQFSTKNPHLLIKLKQDAEKILTANNIKSEKIVLAENTLIIYFANPDIEMQAFEALKPLINDNITLALNLAPATPNWMKYFHASPMKQGLDLRGGVHFLLEVDLDSVIARRDEGLLKNAASSLRDERIRYIGMRKLGSGGVAIKLRDASSLNIAADVLKAKYPELTFTQDKAQNMLNMFMSKEELNHIRQITIEQTMSILRNRVNELGVGEAVVQQQGASRIAVDLPGIQDAAHAKQILGGTATLEFKMLDEEHDPLLAKRSGIVPLQSKLYSHNGRPILLLRQVILSGDAITSASSSFDQQTASPAVHIQLGGGGEQLFIKTSRNSVGKHMAIVFVENKTKTENINGKEVHNTHKEERVISVAVINSALGNSFQITGLASAEEAANLALLLRAGALPASIYPIEEITVGPSLGKENVEKGLISLESGMLLILVIMLIYYRLFGLVADIALILNLIFLSALMSLIGATLTLPGIAGFVLTVGMAVDANVLINERIREELRLGLSPLAAIEVGYDRAFATIIDSNLTTLIVGLVLFAVGSGPVRGFAVILCLGLLTSMLTSITYTRAIVNLIYVNKNTKNLSIGIA